MNYFAIFSVLFFWLYFTCIRGWYKWKLDCRRDVNPSIESFWQLGVVMVVGTSIWWLPLIWSIYSFSMVDFEMRGCPFVMYVGIVILGLASALFHICHENLGVNWFMDVRLRKGHTVSSTGLYHYVRHPMYSLFMLWSLGNVFLWSSISCHPFFPFYSSFMVVGCIGIFSIRASQEETMLRDVPGYVIYQQRVRWKFFPFLY